MANAPQAIWDLWYRTEALYNGPGLQDEELAGIVGDRLHSFGFHLSYNDLVALGKAGSDYSLQTARDRTGAHAHPDDASALDVHFGPNGMTTVTKRLIASAKNPADHRLDCLYEFCGTTNGVSPHPYTVDTNTDDPNNTQGWDDSHVTHVHFSIHRDVCENFDAIKGVADVIAGTTTPTDWFAMASLADLEAAVLAVLKSPAGQNAVWGHEVKNAAGTMSRMDGLVIATNNRTGDIENEVKATRTDVAAIKTKVQA